MPNVIVMGAQWGDEGKGKIVDILSSQADYVIRYQGGANAGHTLKINGKTKVLHLIPSGIFNLQSRCIITAGVVLDIVQLSEEIQAVKASGWLKKDTQLLISDSAVVVLQHHKMLDRLREQKSLKIGTTGRGIGPAYEDRASRKALLFADLFSSVDVLRKKLAGSMQENVFLIEKFYGAKAPALENQLEEILQLREKLEPYRCRDSSHIVFQALAGNKKVLFEGAQGCLLDAVYGTYPYVTSSSTLSGSALTGSGIGPRNIDSVLAAVKSYTTRVGEGPFPTECQGKEGEYLQRQGEEWGATTGRRRRCGWLDLPALKYVVRLNSCTHLALMKLDVLSGLKEIPVCTAYRFQGKLLSSGEFFANSEALLRCEPVYKTLPGWQQDISQTRKFSDLPEPARDYVRFIEEALDLPTALISVGPDRSETLRLKPLFDIVPKNAEQ